jgi:hypothetical protein
MTCTMQRRPILPHCVIRVMVVALKRRCTQAFSDREPSRAHLVTHLSMQIQHRCRYWASNDRSATPELQTSAFVLNWLKSQKSRLSDPASHEAIPMGYRLGKLQPKWCGAAPEFRFFSPADGTPASRSRVFHNDISATTAKPTPRRQRQFVGALTNDPAQPTQPPRPHHVTDPRRRGPLGACPAVEDSSFVWTCPNADGRLR